MKIYTSIIDIAQPALKRFWVAPHSDFKIGVKIAKSGAPAENEFTVASGSTELVADDDKVNGFTVFTISSGDEGFVEYTVTVDGVAEKFKILQIVTDSTVYEVDERGGDMSQYATKNWVESEISGFVEAEDLTAYATKDELTAYAETTDLTAYYTKSETSSATELAEAFAGAGGGAISAFDLSESPVWSKTMVENAVANNICLPQTLVLNTDNSISVVDTSNVLSVSHQQGLQIINDFPNSKKIIVGTKVKTLYGHVRSDNEELVLPNTLTAFGSASSRMFQSNMKYTKIPDSVSNIGEVLSYSSGTYTYSKVVDFGNTRTTVPSYSYISEVGSNIKIYVPDALYDTWIANGSWSNIASQIYRHSELEAPYLYSSKVTNLSSVSGIMKISQADYDALSAGGTADANTLYVIV